MYYPATQGRLRGYVPGIGGLATPAGTAIRGGVAPASLTAPLTGGYAITATLSTSPVLGPNLAPAASVAQITGFTVFEESSALLTGFQIGPVPQTLPGASGSINFVEMGAGIEIMVGCDNALAQTLRNGVITTYPVSWDLTRQCLIEISSSSPALPVQLGGVAVGQVIKPKLWGTGLKWSEGWVAVIRI